MIAHSPEIAGSTEVQHYQTKVSASGIVDVTIRFGGLPDLITRPETPRTLTLPEIASNPWHLLGISALMGVMACHFAQSLAPTDEQTAALQQLGSPDTIPFTLVITEDGANMRIKPSIIGNQPIGFLSPGTTAKNCIKFMGNDPRSPDNPLSKKEWSFCGKQSSGFYEQYPVRTYLRGHGFFVGPDQFNQQ